MSTKDVNVAVEEMSSRSSDSFADGGTRSYRPVSKIPTRLTAEDELSASDESDEEAQLENPHALRDEAQDSVPKWRTRNMDLGERRIKNVVPPSTM